MKKDCKQQKEEIQVKHGHLVDLAKRAVEVEVKLPQVLQWIEDPEKPKVKVNRLDLIRALCAVTEAIARHEAVQSQVKSCKPVTSQEET